MEEVIFLAIFFVLSQVYPLSVALVPTFVPVSFIFSFSAALLWFYFGKPVYSFLFLELLFHALYCFRAFVSSCFLHASVAVCFVF